MWSPSATVFLVSTAAAKADKFTLPFTSCPAVSFTLIDKVFPAKDNALSLFTKVSFPSPVALAIAFLSCATLTASVSFVPAATPVI